MTASSSLSRLNIAFGGVALGLTLSVLGVAFNFALLSWAGLAFSLSSSAIAFMSFLKLKNSLNVIAEVCESAAKGDLEPRIILLNDTGEILHLSHSVNHLLDMSDAFVREAKASFAAVQQGNFHRRIVERGILGTYGQAAKTVNLAIEAMDKRFSEFGELIYSAEQTTERVLSHVLQASHALSSDSNEMISATQNAETGVSGIGYSASETTSDAHFVANVANELCSSSSAIDEQLHISQDLNQSAALQISQTRQAMEQLSNATAEIAPIAEIIRKVAGQTRLLALNANIEAVRAGENGVAFAVVANEVKSLADQTASASDDIVMRIGTIEDSAIRAADTIESFVRTVEELTQISDQISLAVVAQLQSSNNITNAIQKTASRSDEVSNQVNNVLVAIKQTSNQAENVNHAAQKLGSEANVLNQELSDFLKSARKIVGR